MAQIQQLPPDFAMVVDLAVVNQDSVAVVTYHGLGTAAQVYDFEAYCAQRNDRRFPDVLLVGSAVG